MQAQIVRIQRSNLALLRNVDPECFDEPIDLQRAIQCVSSADNALMVAVIDGLVIGQCLAILHRHPDKASEVYLEDLAVTPELQRLGLARSLVMACIGWGREQGATAVWVSTEPGNDVGNAFYRSLGLQERTAFVFDGLLRG